MSGLKQITPDQEKENRRFDNLFDDLYELKKYLDNPKITDIFVNSSGEIIIKKFAEGKVFTGEYVKAIKIRALIYAVASVSGKHIDPLNGFPKLETVLPPPYRARFTGILPPWVEKPEITLRMPPREIFPLENYVEKGRLKPAEYDLICRFIKERKNLLVGGGTGSGKSTFVNAVLKKMLEYTPNDRFYIVEDVPELQCDARDKTMITVLPRHAAEAVRTALRWTPDRIIFGEVRYGEVANELIKSWNTGHSGNITTIHADSCSSMLSRLGDLLKEEIKGSIPRLQDAVHLCVHLTAGPNGPLVDDVIPTDSMIQEDSLEFLRRLVE
jgi:type IV secretion system protein VirB11